MYLAATTNLKEPSLIQNCRPHKSSYVLTVRVHLQAMLHVLSVVITLILYLNQIHFFLSLSKTKLNEFFNTIETFFSTQPASSVSMRDIWDGAVYQKLQSEIYDPFITLNLNADGIQPHKSSTQTIWPILLVINEVPLKRRFALENVILAGV